MCSHPHAGSAPNYAIYLAVCLWGDQAHRPHSSANGLRRSAPRGRAPQHALAGTDRSPGAVRCALAQLCHGAAATVRWCGAVIRARELHGKVLYDENRLPGKRAGPGPQNMFIITKDLQSSRTQANKFADILYSLLYYTVPRIVN